jgi:hypothetical protein
VSYFGCGDPRLSYTLKVNNSRWHKLACERMP